jgi:hypothetical protein
MRARSRSSSLAARAGLLILAMGPLLLMTACTKQLQSSFCTDYQQSWDDFTSVRDSGTATPQELLDAGQNLRDRWDELNATSDAPDDVTGMLGISVSTFTSAWNARSSAERGPYERSLQNERDYIALQCSKIDSDIEFAGDVAPIETPRLN